jgi:hypothetical protein
MDEEQKTDPTIAPQGAVSPTGGGGGAVRLSPQASVPPVGGGTPGATPGSAPTPAAGGSFASLDKYLSANQGQAAPLAGKLTPGISQEYGNLDAANNAAIANINSQVTNAPGYTQSNPNVMAAEAANPVSFANDPNNVKQFQSLLNNTYSGPASAEGTANYTNQQNAINNAIATGKANTTTEAGRENLLVKNEATPTTGVTALNSAILSQDPNALASVQDAYKPFNNLLTNLQTGAQGVNQTIGKEQTDAATSAKAANDAIASQIGTLNTGVTNELTAAQQKAATQNAQLKTDIAAGTPSAADLQVLGMTADQWNALSAANKDAATAQQFSSARGQFGATSGTTTIDPTQFLTQKDPNAVFSTANVATPEEYAKAQAFRNLVGNINLGTPAPIINQMTAGQAGTAPTNTNAYDYQTALKGAQDTAKAQKIGAQAYADALQGGADDAHAQVAASNAVNNANKAGLIGSTIGGTVGTFWGPAGTAVGAVAGNVLGRGAYNTFEGIKEAAAHPSKMNLGTAANLATGNVVQTISQIFCFHPDTQVEMANGGVKSICKIQIGDDTRGGKVLATTRGLGQGFYWYGGVIVTAKHAVKEDGVWVRVENSRNARQFPYLTEVVCNLVTEKHRIWAGGIEFADEHENDNYENLNLKESLDALNNNG